MSEDVKLKINVIRVNSYDKDISFLEYENLSEEAFPKLFTSIRAGNDFPYPRKTDYSCSNNPPILHRKELLLPPDHPDIPKFAALTKQLEDAGLFKDSRKIGYKKQWEERLRNAGYKVVDHKLVKLDGSEIAPPETTEKTSNVERHRTALTRYALSKPMQLLAKHDFLEGKHTIFDYGCGKGSDVDILRQNNLTANGWDPHFCPDNAKHTADIVNLGFVINVIEDKTERMEAVLGAYQLCTQFLCAAVMLGEQSSERGRLFRDGVLTSRNTFQRYYSQEEFREYLRQVLDEDPVAVGPGVFFVFKDKDAEQAFLERRYRNRATANRLISQLPKVPKAPKAERAARLTKADKERAFYEQHAALLDALWLRWLELGRPPQDDEFPDLAASKELFGTTQRALKFLQRFHGDELLKLAFDSRRDDLTVYFAMRRFDQQRIYRHLPESLKRDVKAFFQNYPHAQTDGERLLFSAGNPALLRQMCQQAAAQGYGYLDEEGAFTFHTAQVVALPPILRVYIGCATFVFGDVTSADLLKIHAESGKLSLMKYDDFEESPLPRLLERIKISLVNQRFEYYKYGDTYTPPYLYRKARFLTPDFPHYAEQLAFDQVLATHPEFALDGYGMPPEQFDATLQRLRLAIVGFELQPAQHTPALNDPCGQYHTFRDFIECGATQANTGLPNLPKQPDTYNALAALALHIIDPVMDYFGGIELTYGFCSPELAKHIKGSIDPKRDQHAAHEVNTRGNLICERKGAACDFIVPDENMLEVAQWIVQNTPFDRLYFYGNDKPLHVSYGDEHNRAIVLMLPGKSGRLVPKVVTAERFAAMTTEV
ncbi:DNA phosphorothioation-associated putative methyltransferase [Thiothrix subterranea]|uniref:DNA phosphorothioation-associated putative methyltransferase n=1 Tax=Thiothrix subterranea TaxID=2735563 RepID=A0AA51MPG0_9GAMM|nr:DNA phosphorothioation-associated putative methyltransferase [Thiothrix subterranea]WML87888.1 DNA phosphorothioation-associated putative methyltransferase [Thiothrix subterranea]